MEGEGNGLLQGNLFPPEGTWASTQFNRLMMDLEILALSLHHLSLSKEK